MSMSDEVAGATIQVGMHTAEKAVDMTAKAVNKIKMNMYFGEKPVTQRIITKRSRSSSPCGFKLGESGSGRKICDDQLVQADEKS